MARRVVVTGIGLISPLGVGTDATWEGLLAGRSGIGPITRFDASTFPVRIAGEVKGFEVEQWLEPKEARKHDRFCHFAVAAADLALRGSGFEITPANAARVGVVIGSGIGGLPLIEEQHSVFVEKGARRVSPFFIPGAIVNMTSGLVSIRSGAKGPNMSTCTACSTGAHAIGDAFLYIQRGYCDAALAGGAEAVITGMALAGFGNMKALSTRNDEPEKASRPFDRDRDGFVIGEGAGILMLEEYEAARRRGATIVCEVLGFGMSGDAFHITAPSLHQRPRHLDAVQRRDRDDRDQAGVRRARPLARDFVDQVGHRPPARRGRRTRGGDRRARGGARADPAHPQPRQPRRRVRPRLHAAPRRDTAGADRDLQLVRVRRHQRLPGHGPGSLSGMSVACRLREARQEFELTSARCWAGSEEGA
ncbi:MAG: 3-oxoacyl-(acyl carrier protein) synthase [Acidobacteria bacterium]|nr:3-oxoacyl-(acyl carrier protein) synthase [Acidobacteriota bacterium]